MITLEDNSLVFRFPDLDEKAEFRLNFQRTLRIPDDGRTYPLPAGLGRFPIAHVDDHASNLPPRLVRRGGVLIPMWQSEAMWINFSNRANYHGSASYPFAVKIATGKINAVTGTTWSEGLSDDPQDYVVVTRQPWLDGYCVEKGIIRQFVAVRLGEGVTIEEQITGAAEHGGVQIIAYPMKPDVYERLFGHRDVISYLDACEKSISENSLSMMGLAAGGKMRQEIFEDPYGIDAWDQTTSSRCFITIARAEDWKTITGAEAPTQPLNRKQYASAGIPWFDYYDPKLKALGGSSVLAKVISVFGGKEENGGKIFPPVNIGPSIRPVREFESDRSNELQRQLDQCLEKFGDIADALKVLQKHVAETVASLEGTLKERERPRGPKTILQVIYKGSPIIREHAADVLAEVIRKVGVDRVHTLNLKLGGLPLASKSMPPSDRGFRNVDGYFVITHASNADKKVVLEEIARRLSLDLRVDVLQAVA
ncbi:hypothetical protein G5V57_18145 [Nordella sp. HKS 07]|uniref:hypothetical protein n=1 Tax=Nordella sp. HKS 07 TaxID=2712222 RepID=UPI0013E0F3F3|nr:hypothetical protein [Nordella sp. HKS 07]QIG49466.1 hypothetical protein G5V57_18145 [Nordella sp. HKS 07]